MMRAGIAALAAVLVALSALGPAWADESADANVVTRIVKFAGTRESAITGRPMTMLSATSKYGGSPLDVAIPNADANARKADPLPAVMAVLKPLQKGDLIKVRYAGAPPRSVLIQVEKFTARPGEEDPEAYEFIRLTEANVAGQIRQTVLLRKADKDQTVQVFSKKDDANKLVADEAVLAQAGKLSAGDLVDAEITQAGGTAFLRGIYPYQAPKTATFVKAGSVKSDALTLALVELKADAQTSTVYVRPFGPANAPDPAMLGRTRSIQANASVSYKAVDDGGKQWLLDIRANAQPGEVTFANGTFTWSGKPRQVNALKAVLKPTANNNEWSAVYTFTWDGAAKTYVGVIKGDLKNGAVSGTGDGDRRNFSFEGTSQNGVITFKAFETTGGKKVPSGSGTMK